MSTGSENLKANQRQLDMDGCEVGVSRQALDETLSEYSEMIEALQVISEAAGAFNRDPVIHAQNCIRDMQAEAIAVLCKHGIKPRGKPVK